MFRLTKEDRVKIGNTGMHKRTTIPRPTAPVVKLPKRPAISSVNWKYTNDAGLEVKKTQDEWQHEYNTMIDE